ncbi:MAG: hypothetical protein ABSE84_00240 [Isosphaeraceae bacterium]|jgi:hypothetical protein
MKISQWIELLQGMDPETEASCMYESEAAIVLNAMPTTVPNPDPIRVLHELFEVGDLEDHFYAIREREGQGWDGPLMLRWGKACADARQVLQGFKP